MVRLSGAAMAAVLLAGFIAPSAGAQDQPLKLAYVNSAMILQNTPGRAQAESTFQHELAGYQQQVNVLQAQFDSATSDYNRTSLVLSPTAKQQRMAELQQMQQRMQQQVQDLRDRANQREQELMTPITQRVTAVIDGIRAEFNYAMIFDASAQNGALVSADRSLDISQLVIQRLQAAGAQPPAAAVQPAAAPPLPAQAPADTTHPAPARPPRGTRPPRP